MRGITYLFVIGIILVVLGLGVYIPVKALEAFWRGSPNAWVGLIFAFFSLIGAGIVGITGFAIAGDLIEHLSSEGAREGDIRAREEMRAYRARQRAMLEELDEMVDLLREIRDLLRAAGE